MLDLLNQNNLGPQANKTATAADILRESKQTTKRHKKAPPSQPKSRYDQIFKKRPTDATSTIKP